MNSPTNSYDRLTTRRTGYRRVATVLTAAALVAASGVLAMSMLRGSEQNASAPSLALSREQTRDVAAAHAAAPNEPGLFDWNSDLDWLSKRSMSTLTFEQTAKPFWQQQTPDLPVPAPQVTRAEAESRQMPASEQQAPVVREVAAPPPRLAQDVKPEAAKPQASRRDAAKSELSRPEAARLEAAHAATPRLQAVKPHRVAARATYMEKLVEQGDAGDIRYHYRRQVCGPHHMVDVCYMPAENRRNIVIERW